MVEECGGTCVHWDVFPECNPYIAPANLKDPKHAINDKSRKWGGAAFVERYYHQCCGVVEHSRTSWKK